MVLQAFSATWLGDEAPPAIHSYKNGMSFGRGFFELNVHGPIVCQVSLLGYLAPLRDLTGIFSRTPKLLDATAKTSQGKSSRYLR